MPAGLYPQSPLHSYNKRLCLPRGVVVCTAFCDVHETENKQMTAKNLKAVVFCRYVFRNIFAKLIFGYSILFYI